MKILLIDDTRELTNYCDDHDLAEIAKNYEEGIIKLKEQMWEILYLDYKLETDKTGMDVLEFLSDNLQFLPKEIKVVSSYSSDIIKEMNQKIEVLYLMKKRG
jgi:hypothetical protein